MLRRWLTILAHRYDWHYAPVHEPIYPDGSFQRWCQWCGLRETYSYDPRKPITGPLTKLGERPADVAEKDER